MSPGRARVEVARLKHTLEVPVADLDLDFLAELAPAEVAHLRRSVDAARHARQAGRFARLAGITRFLPIAVAAKAAEGALGPLVSARTASVMEPAEATRLAERISPEFLAELTAHLEPTRATEIVAGLPADLLVAVGRRMLASGDHLTLGGFVGVMPAAASVEVVRDASGLAILEIAVHAEDAAALDEVLTGLPDATLARVLTDAGEHDRADDAVLLMTSLGLDARTRLFELLPGLDRLHQRRLVRAVVRQGAWEHVLPVLSRVRLDALQHLVALPEIADPDLLGALMRHDG
ncbi:MAG TPA: hypothetical protein VGE77_06910 [Nocardioides sp.]